MKSALRLAIILSVVLLGTVVAFRAHQRYQVLRLYEAVHDSTRSSAERVQVVHGIGASSGSLSVQLLIEIASDPAVYIDCREAAVRELSIRGDAYAIMRIAELLQPHVAPSLRLAIANALNSSCPQSCIRLVMHYLERSFRGETSYYEPPGQVKSYLEDTERQIQQALLAPLKKEPNITLSVLEDTYGLGSRHPSPFALLIVEQLRLAEACAKLSSPFRTSPPTSGALLSDIEKLKAKLQCP